MRERKIKDIHFEDFSSDSIVNTQPFGILNHHINMNRGLFFASMALRTASSFVSPGRALSLHHPALSPVRWVSTNPQQPQSQSQSQSQNTNIRPDNINSQQPQSLDSFVPPDTKIQIGDAITFEVISFGPLGASLQFLPSKPSSLPPSSSTPPPISAYTDSDRRFIMKTRGLLYQDEIALFQQKRGYKDPVEVGEILSGYVLKIRPDGKIDVSLRQVGFDKIQDIVNTVLEELQELGTLGVGERSPPEAIEQLFPGISKSSFKKAVAILYKARKITIGDDKRSINLVE